MTRIGLCVLAILLSSPGEIWAVERPHLPTESQSVSKMGFPRLQPSSDEPVHLTYTEPASLETLLGELCSSYGISLLFDESFRDKKMTLDIADAEFPDVLEKILMVNRLFYKVLDPTTILVAPDNAQKRRQYDEFVLHTFFIKHTDINVVANMFRTLAAIQRVQPNPEQRSISVRATPDQVVVAQRIVELNDRMPAEVALSIEVLAVEPVSLMEMKNLDKVMTFTAREEIERFKSVGDVEVLASQLLHATRGRPVELQVSRDAETASAEEALSPYLGSGILLTAGLDVSLEGDLTLSLDLLASARDVASGSLNVRRSKSEIRLQNNETTMMDTMFRVGNLWSDSEQVAAGYAVVVTVAPRILRAPAVTEEDLVPLRIGTEQKIKIRND
jgi:hypothetical protein